MNKIFSKNRAQTQKLAKLLSERLLKMLAQKKAVIVGLIGELGSGKTTFIQGLAKGLGVREKILSPTFVILKKFNLKPQLSNFKYFYHIDCYRFNDCKVLLELGWKDIVTDPRNIVAVEWADRIKKICPSKIIELRFEWPVSRRGKLDKNRRQIKTNFDFGNSSRL